MKQALLKKYSLNAERVRIVKNWTATSDFLKIGAERKKKLKIDRFNIIFVGWVEKEKGIERSNRCSIVLKGKKNKF